MIVIFIALALNFNLFSNSEKTKTIILPPSKEEVLIVNKPQAINTTRNYTVIIDNNLSQELKKLLQEAETFSRYNKSSEALALYEKVIEKSQNSKDIKILKLFAEACFKKAHTHYAYPNFDISAAIESYELISNKFINSHDKALLLLYMEAKIQQAPFISKNEILLAYDELIDKFTNDKEQRFDKEIEELLFAKSFALMGVDDEEAIEVLDSIIAKYKDKSKLPNTVKYSILNNIELSIITANDTEKYVDLAEQYMSDSPDTQPLLDMLNIIKNAQNLEQDEALEKWNKEHQDYDFPNWDFSELRKWVNNMEIPDAQARIRKYLDIFEKQKYLTSYQVQTTEPIKERRKKTDESDSHFDDSLNIELENSYSNPYSVDAY